MLEGIDAPRLRFRRPAWPRALVVAADRGVRDKGMGERASSFDYEALLACGRGELFGEGNAQLPLPPMLMFDRITRIAECLPSQVVQLGHRSRDENPQPEDPVPCRGPRLNE